MNKPLTHQQESNVAVAAKSAGQPTPTGSVLAEPSHAAIAQQAYDIYVKTGRKAGQCKQNWQEAEKVLLDQCQRGPKG